MNYKFINPDEFSPILKNNPLWYLEPKILKLIDEYVLPSKEGKPQSWVETRKEVKNLFTQALEENKISLGHAPEEFNDDDRWCKKYFGKNPKVEKDHPDTIVIHHTATPADTSLSYIDAMGLILVYLPLYKNGLFNKKPGEFVPISSGHFRNGKQTFINYHYLVKADDTFEQSLKDEYVGFHAGDYKTNCRSLGIAIVDDLENKMPTEQAIKTMAEIIKRYHPETVIGHKEVLTTNGKPVDTVCPGNLWKSWKPILLNKI